MTAPHSAKDRGFYSRGYHGNQSGNGFFFARSVCLIVDERQFTVHFQPYIVPVICPLDVMKMRVLSSLSASDPFPFDSIKAGGHRVYTCGERSVHTAQCSLHASPFRLRGLLLDRLFNLV